MKIKDITTLGEFVEKHEISKASYLLDVPYGTLKSRLKRSAIWHVGKVSDTDHDFNGSHRCFCIDLA